MCVELKDVRFGENFYYILYHNEYETYGRSWPVDDAGAVTGPAEREYDTDVAGFLKQIYLSGAAQTSAVKALPQRRPLWREAKRGATGWRPRLPSYDALPPWLPQEALDEFVEAFKASGFRRWALGSFLNGPRGWRELLSVLGPHLGADTGGL